MKLLKPEDELQLRVQVGHGINWGVGTFAALGLHRVEGLSKA